MLLLLLSFLKYEACIRRFPIYIHTYIHVGGHLGTGIDLAPDSTCQLERGMSMKRKVDDAASGCANHYCNDDEKDLKDILIESLQKQLAEAR